MHSRARAGMSLYGSAGGRKYLNAVERQRFTRARTANGATVLLGCFDGAAAGFPKS